MTSGLMSDLRTHRLRLELEEDSHHLRELKLAIDEVLAHPRITANHWGELQELLNDLRDQLSLHFALEEADGYLDCAVESHPERASDADHLRHQHEELFEEIRTIADSAMELSTEKQRKMEALVERFRRFRSSLEAHEEAEWDLIQQVMDEDLGVGD